MHILPIKNDIVIRCVSIFLVVLLFVPFSGCTKQEPDTGIVTDGISIVTTPAPGIALPPDLPDMQYIIPDEYALDAAVYSFCLSPDGSVFASITGRTVLQFDVQGNVINQYPIETVLFNTVLLDGTLYGYAYDDGGTIVALDTETGEVQSLPFAYQADQIHAMTGSDGKLLLLCSPTGSLGGNNELVLYTVADESYVIVPSDTISALSPLDTGRVLLYGYDGKNYLAEMDMQRMAIGKKTYLDIIGAAGAVAQNQVSGDLFFGSRDSAGITGVFADTPNKPVVVWDEIAPHGSNDLQFRDGYLFVLDINTNTLHRHKVVPPAKEAITLQIDQSFSFSYLTERTIPGLSDWTREYRTQTGNNASTRAHFTEWDQLLTELASGSDKIDAFIINIEGANLHSIFDQGAYHPMAGGDFDQFYDKAFDWVTDTFSLGDGSYSALPVWLDADKIYYNPSKLNEYGLDVSLFDSFDTMMETAEMLKDKRKNELCNVIITGTLYISYSQPYQYFATKGRDNTTFDTPEFRSAMHTLKRFYDLPQEDGYEDYIFRIKAPLEPTLRDVVFMTVSDSWVQRMAHSSIINPRMAEAAAYEKMLVLPYPKLNGDADMPSIVSMDVLIINPNSKNKEEVLRFAECAAKALLSPARADASEPPISMLFEDKDIYQNVYNADSAQFESLYQYYSNGVVPNMPFDVLMYLYEYGIGEASEDDTIFAIERYMEMRLKEAQ